MLMAVPRDQVEACLGLLTEATLRPVAVELAPAAAAKVFALSGRPLPPSWLLLFLLDDAYELTHIQGPRVKAFAQGRNLRGKDLARAIQPRSMVWRRRGRNPRRWVSMAPAGLISKSGRSKKHELEVIYPSQLPIPGLAPEMNLGEVLPAVGAGLSCFGPAALGVNLLPRRRGRLSGWDDFLSPPSCSWSCWAYLPLGDQCLYPHPRRTLPGQPADSRVEPGSQGGGGTPPGEPGPGQSRWRACIRSLNPRISWGRSKP